MFFKNIREKLKYVEPYVALDSTGIYLADFSSVDFFPNKPSSVWSNQQVEKIFQGKVCSKEYESGRVYIHMYLPVHIYVPGR